MPSIASKAANLPFSPIRKLVPYAEAAKKKGIKVFHLNIGQPDIDSPAILYDGLQAYKEKHIPYSHSAGMEVLREKIKDYYTNWDIPLTIEDILVTTGGSEALLFAMMACCNAEDEIIVTEPFYANYNSFAQLLGIKIVPITTTIEENFALPSTEAFEAKITSKTKAILLCNPSNPTGYVYSKEELEKLKTITQAHDLYLIVDEVYREFCYDGMAYTSALHLEGLEENVIVIDSFSKRYNLCGIRIGAIISRNKAVMQAALKMAQARLSPPTLGQIAAISCLDASKAYFDGVTKEYQSRRDLVVSKLNKINGVTCSNPKGAFYIIASLPVDSAENFCIWLLNNFNYQNTTIMLAPANGFYSSAMQGQTEVRIAYVLEKQELEMAIDCLEMGLQGYIRSI